MYIRRPKKNKRGHVVAYFDEALCYKLEGHGFEYQ
jgi:hypothetical protein